MMKNRKKTREKNQEHFKKREPEIENGSQKAVIPFQKSIGLAVVHILIL
jgi:hypothetical protein